jgi:Hint domain
MSSPTFTPTIIGESTWFSLVWTDVSAYFLPEYNYKVYFNGTLNNAPLTINSTSQLTFSPAIIVSGQGFYNVRVYGTNGTFAYDKTATTQLNVNCYVKGSEILTDNGYQTIENLKIGDNIKIYNGEYKKIKYLSYRLYKNDTSYNQITKISKLQNQTKDLFISSGHSILVDELTDTQKMKTLQYWNDYHMIDDKYLLLACVSEFEKITDDENYELYHIVLENDDKNKQYGIYVNGILSESMSENCYDNIFKTLQVIK